MDKTQKEEVSKEQAAGEQAAGEQACVRCGLPYAVKTLSISEDDKKEYIRRLLANEPYRKTYQLFNGAVVVVIENLTNKEALILAKLLRNPPDKAESNLQSQVIRMKGISYLRQVGSKVLPKLELTDVTTSEELLARWDEATGCMNEDLVLMVVQTLLHHYRYLNALAESAFDPNFWKGAGYV